MRVPKLCLHKASGRACCYVNGRTLYLGAWGSTEAQEAYARLLMELSRQGDAPAPATSTAITIEEVVYRFLRFAIRYYRDADGNRTTSYDIFKYAGGGLVEHYGTLPAVEFGPRALKDLQHAWELHTPIHRKACITRSGVNRRVKAVKAMFKWAASEELIPVTVYQALATVAPLRKGRSEARETQPVGPVPEAHVTAVLAKVGETVREMIRFQLLTGCRPGEMLFMRRGDLNMNEEVWAAELTHHKTSYRGRGRVVYIGPQAQTILRDRLLRPLDKRLFDTHTVGSYRRAIRRACIRLKIPIWFPNQLRHNAATRIRREYGLDAAQKILGHARADVTQVYAEVDGKRAADIMREIG